ncbi:AbrB/MazE/SpoVT family DNA-binding domain-containing protein [Bacillaceae bacterium Marseille-Q3522]|nr:AbrB/MazE/SpoVT family DNA-binding domain-containing protein [Bacillaceae bacterium Marseille-Q3522]
MKDAGREIFDASAKMSLKGQVTIPKRIRTKLGAKKGDELVFSLTEKNEVIVKVKQKPSVLNLIGALPSKVDVDKDWDKVRQETKDEMSEKMK